MAKIDSVFDFSDKALVELKSWLEPWFLTRGKTKTTVPPSFSDLVGTFSVTHELRGYWRLGEGASPFHDTSGHPFGAADGVKTVTGTAMTDSITGALPAANDDGAVQFNNTAGAGGDYLDCPDPSSGGSRRFNFNAGHAMTVAAWVNPTASTNTFGGTAVGVWVNASNLCGWRIGVTWPARTPFFQRREDSGGANVSVTGTALAAGAWAFLVGTYDSVNGHRLYVNGTLAASNASTFVGLPIANTGPNIGTANAVGDISSFYGGVDEIVVWGDALSASEIASLYSAGVTSSGVAASWFHGSGVPASSLGSDGDYYLDVALGDVWFKASGAWSMIWDEP